MVETRADQVFRRLKGEEFKVTDQRRLIIRTLLRLQEEHPSAEDLFQAVRDEAPDVGLATIYRTLELLERLEIIRGVNFGDGRSRYEFTGELHQHHHVLCIRCDAIVEVDEDLLGEVEDRVAERLGFTIVDHDLKLYGICPKCRAETEDDSHSVEG